MGLRLIMQTGDGGERAFPLQARSTIIGRATRCDVRIPLPTVSDRHCEITIKGGCATLVNLDADHKTLRNGLPIDRSILEDADLLQIGSVTFRVKYSPDESVPGVLIERKD